MEDVREEIRNSDAYKEAMQSFRSLIADARSSNQDTSSSSDDHVDEFEKCIQLLGSALPNDYIDQIRSEVLTQISNFTHILHI